MWPALWTGDFCVIYKTKNIKRCDIVCLKINSELNIVKRVVGLPGEKIYIGKGGVALLGKDDKIKALLPERYVNIDYKEKEFIIQLASDEIWAIGDNRANSWDSRDHGPFKLSQVQGKILCILARLPNVGNELQIVE